MKNYKLTYSKTMFKLLTQLLNNIFQKGKIEKKAKIHLKGKVEKQGKNYSQNRGFVFSNTLTCPHCLYKILRL